MFTYPLGGWTLVFERAYRIIRDDTAAVVIDEGAHRAGAV